MDNLLFGTFLHLSKKRTIHAMSFRISDLREENLSHFSLFPGNGEDKSSCYGALMATSSPDVHKLMWFLSTTL